MADWAHVWLLTNKAGTREMLVRADSVTRFLFSADTIYAYCGDGSSDPVVVVEPKFGLTPLHDAFLLELFPALDKAARRAAEDGQSIMVSAYVEKDGWHWRAGRHS